MKLCRRRGQRAQVSGDTNLLRETHPQKLKQRMLGQCRKECVQHLSKIEKPDFCRRKMTNYNREKLRLIFCTNCIMFIVFLFLIFFLNTNSLFNSIDSSDDIANKIMSYVHENEIPLVLTDKIIGDEAGSMSSVYNGYLNNTNQSSISVVVKYSSFKSIWNYVHISDINRLYDDGCYSNVHEHTNEYLVLKEDKNRIINEGWIPSEVYVSFKGYFCENLMPTATIVNPLYSYFSFFQSIEQTDDERTFFLILKKIDNGISLKKYLEQYSNNLTIDIAKYLIYSILNAILKLKQMSIIHLDLNSGNIFLMNNDAQHPIRFIDFGIMKFIHRIEEMNVMYSENLHQSLRSIFMNCPSCYSFQTPIFAQQYHTSFKSYLIEEIINLPWFYTNEVEFSKL